RAGAAVERTVGAGLAQARLAGEVAAARRARAAVGRARGAALARSAGPVAAAGRRADDVDGGGGVVRREPVGPDDDRRARDEHHVDARRGPDPWRVVVAVELGAGAAGPHIEDRVVGRADRVDGVQAARRRGVLQGLIGRAAAAAAAGHVVAGADG